MVERLRREESGFTMLEKLGIALVILTALVFVPAIRGAIGDAYDAIFKNTDESGNITQASIAARGVLVTVTALIAFNGTGFLLLYTNLGKRLAFLVGGAASFGWLAIGSLLFTVYAPRGLRPARIEGLNAFQIRVPAAAVMIGSFILFVMFLAAMNRLEEAETAETA